MDDDVTSKQNESSNARDHMANERTFLAWIRTSIGIMAFGFVVEKFAIFIKQVTFFLEQSSSPMPSVAKHSLQGYSSIFGVLLVGLGALIGLLSFLKYKNVEKQIERATYKPAVLLNLILTLSVLLIGTFLVVYLSNSL